MDISALPDLVNGDPVLVRRGRWLTTTFLLEIGEDKHLVSVHEGRITGIVTPGLTPSWTFAFRAPAEAWEKFWQPVPEPGYNDIFALIRWGRMRLEGNLQPLMANLLYLKEVLASPRKLEGKR